MHPESRLILFELDPELAEHLEKQFRGNDRVVVLNSDAARLSEELAKRGERHCDYIVSGIPFSILEPEKKRELLRNTYDSLAPQDHSAFIIYQVTNELVGHCRHFPRVESEYCLKNLPPMFVTKYYKTANGHARNGHTHNGNGRH
jgi:phospholipid N-methyltransferase